MASKDNLLMNLKLEHAKKKEAHQKKWKGATSYEDKMNAKHEEEALTREYIEKKKKIMAGKDEAPTMEQRAKAACDAWNGKKEVKDAGKTIISSVPSRIVNEHRGEDVVLSVRGKKFNAHMGNNGYVTMQGGGWAGHIFIDLTEAFSKLATFESKEEMMSNKNARVLK